MHCPDFIACPDQLNVRNTVAAKVLPAIFGTKAELTAHGLLLPLIQNFYNYYAKRKASSAFYREGFLLPFCGHSYTKHHAQKRRCLYSTIMVEAMGVEPMSEKNSA